MALVALAIAVCGHFFSHWLTARAFGLQVKLAFPCCCAPLDADAFHKAGKGKRALVLLAGPLLGYVIGVLPLTLLLAAPAEVPTLTIETAAAEFPAAKAGLLPGDVIVGIDGDRAHSFQQLKDVLAAKPQKVLLDVHRPGEIVQVELEPTLMPDGNAVIGILPRKELVSTTLPEAFVGAHRWSLKWIERAMEPEVRTVGGPVVLYQVASRSSGTGGLFFALALMLMNFSLLITLASLLPLPGLDGGLLLLSLLELFGQRPADHAFHARARVWLLWLGVVLGGALVVLIIRNDLTRLLH